MITPEQIKDWIREAEERPGSAPLIIQYIANRLDNLTRRYEELLDENTQLLTGKKVEEYETRIATLEYQLGLLKRQLSGELVGTVISELKEETISVLIFTAQGLVLRLELTAQELTSGKSLGRLVSLFPTAQDGTPTLTEPQLLAARSNEELLFLFDSGRTVTIPVADIPVATSLDWEEANIEEPRGGEELAAVIPIGRMSLADSCVQASRQGALKKMPRAAFESYVAKNFVGSGVKRNTDRTCSLVLCAKEDRVALASQLGYLLTAETANLAYSIEETIRLNPDDHIVSAFSLGQKKQVIFLTRNGKALVRETGWLTPAGVSLRTRGQSLFSEERRKSGTTLVGATAADDQDWMITLDSEGSISLFTVRQLLGMGTVFPEPGGGLQLISFAVLSEQVG